MVQWARRIAERRNTQVAITALARKMAGVLYAMWRDGQPYQPQLAVRAPDARGLSSGDSTA
jgi:hypothetical protein